MNNKRWILAALAMAFFATGLFVLYLDESAILLTTDAMISGANKTLAQVAAEAMANWDSGVLLGMQHNASTEAANLLKAVLPGVIWNNVVYGLACLVASVIFLFGFRKKLNVWAALCGALAAFWLGSNFTLIYAGHGLKPYVVLFFICSLFAAEAPSWRGGVLWGGCAGLMFAQQPDVAMFFALFAGAYMIFRLWMRQGLKPLKWIKVLLPAAVVAFLFAGGPLLSGYEQQVKGAAQMQSNDKQAKWDYVTQWSFPPEELIAFVAPGYTGWRSGEPEGPYWGRMGRSAGWKRAKQGFQNFKLENTYLGVIPIAFALFALFSCRRSKHRAEILFWGGAALVALLLSFGKFFPLYSVFYQLPVVNNIRNPNKFLQVFQVCLAILTAYGADRLFRSGEWRVASGEGALRPKAQRLKPANPSSDFRLLTSENRKFFYFLSGILGLLTLWALSLTLDRSGDVNRFMAQGWPQDAAQVIAKNKITSLWHATFMASILAFVFSIFSFPRFGKLLKYKNWIAAGLVLIVAADAVKLSKHYIKEMPRSYIEANALTDFLKENLGYERVALISQQGIYNIWVSYLLPFNRIPSFNVAQIGRMPQDYQQLLETGSKNPLRMWRFAGVKYLLGPAVVEKQLPPGELRKVFAYDLAPGSDGGFRLLANPAGTQAVFEFTDPISRYSLVKSAGVGDEEILSRIADARQPLLGTGRAPGSADVLQYSPGRVEISVQTDEPCLLRVAERWDPDWKATVDGKPVEVQKIDFICQGVRLPAGRHTVVMTYSPSKLFFFMQCAGYLILAFAWILKRLSRHEKN